MNNSSNKMGKALFTKATKTRVSGMMGELLIKTFTTPVSEGGKEAITIQLNGEDMRTYSITLYGSDIDYLKYKLRGTNQ